MTALETLIAAHAAGQITWEQIAASAGEDAGDWDGLAEWAEYADENAAADVVRDLIDGIVYESAQKAQIQRLYENGQISRATYESRIRYL